MSVTSPAGSGPFDKRAVGRDFGRAAAGYESHAALQRQVAGEVADGLAARLGAEWQGPLADLGCGTGLLGRALTGRGLRPDPLLQLDLAPAMARRAVGLHDTTHPAPALVGDVERLPFADDRLAAVASSLTLQWCNDLPAVLAEAHRVLAPGGLFLAATVLEGTLGELANALEVVDGEPPPVGPFRSAAAMRQTLEASPFTDTACLEAPRLRRAADPAAVLRELRGLGATAKRQRGGGLGGRDRLARLRAAYREVAGAAKGPVPVTWNVAFLVAWKPSRP